MVGEGDSMSKFTPGKWVIKELLTGYGVFSYTADERIGIADCLDNEANARLIAAAPEMYDAIKKLISKDSTIDTAEALLDAFLELKILIARIDGEETQL